MEIFDKENICTNTFALILKCFHVELLFLDLFGNTEYKQRTAFCYEFEWLRNNKLLRPNFPHQHVANSTSVKSALQDHIGWLIPSFGTGFYSQFYL